MDKKRSRRWKALIPVAAFLASLILLVFTCQRYNISETWTGQELAASTKPKLNIDLGHGPVAHQPPTDSNDISLHLHPEEHIYRESRTVKLFWNITKDYRRPDGVAKEVYLINGQFPGPTIEVRSGDVLVLTIYNGLQNESTSIQWPGLSITDEVDGLVGLTQCAIAPGHEIEHRLAVPEATSGTFWYHAPSDSQRFDGLFGPLVVLRPAKQDLSDGEMYGYDDDQILMVGDWYHHRAIDILEPYADPKDLEIEPSPDSLLLNGRGYFECSRATRLRPMDCQKNKIPHFSFSGRTRLRVLNVGSLTGFTLSFAGYTLELFEVDGGHRVESVLSRKIGILYPGEQMDLILEPKLSDNDQSGWITISLDRETMVYPNLVLVDTQQFPIQQGPRMENWTPRRRMNPKPKNLSWIDLSQVKSTNGYPAEKLSQPDKTACSLPR